MVNTSLRSILLYYSCFIFWNNIQCLRVNYFDAVKFCAEKGGLASSSSFPRINVSFTCYEHPRNNVLYSQLKDVDLKDGESAWVAGYAKYGGIFHRMGCNTGELQTVIASSDTSENIGFHQCSNYCQKQDREFTWMSLNRSSCSCIDKIHYTVFRGVLCPNNHDDTRLNELFLRHTKRNKNKYQCSLLTVDDLGRIDFAPSKCLGKNRLSCRFSSRNYCNNDTYPYCFLPYLTTWPDGNTECNRRGGSLFSSDKPIFKSYRNDKFWTEDISAYTVTTEVQKRDACLAVTRLGDQLVLEPDDCEAKLSFICASNIIHNTTAFSDNNNSALSYGNNTASSEAIISIIQTTATLDSKVPHQPYAIDININLVVIATCITLVAVAAITASVRVLLHKTSNIERRKTNTDQFTQNHAIIENPICDVANHVYATVDEIGFARTDENVESHADNLNENANLASTSQYLTVVGENDTLTLVCLVDGLEKTATNINRENNNVDPDANSLWLGETTLKIPNTASNGTNACTTGDLYNDASWYEQSTSKTAKSVTKIYEWAIQGSEDQDTLLKTTKAVNKDGLPTCISALKIRKLGRQDTSKHASGEYIEGKCASGEYIKGKCASGEYIEEKRASGEYIAGKCPSAEYIEGKCPSGYFEDVHLHEHQNI